VLRGAARCVEHGPFDPLGLTAEVQKV